MKLKLAASIAAAMMLVACGQQPAAPAADAPVAAPAQPTPPPAEEKVLNIYNWSDYIAEDTIANFEAETGIKVTYDVYDSNEVLEAKLLAGNTGYDLVVPSLSFLARQIQAGVYQPLDRSKLSNYGNLDTELLQRIAPKDSGNAHSVPYMWGTTGIGFNPEKVAAALGDDAPTDSWDLVFKVENISKLHSCGVAVLDTPQELIPIALHYLGEDPNSFDEAVIRKAEALLATIRPHITYFHSSQFINDLGNGDVCLAVGWSGDILMAAERAEEADKGVTVEYVLPKEGGPMWFDMLAIPKDAPHPDNAHAFIDYLMRPQVAADISNYVSYPSANKSALELVDEEIRGDVNIYPPEDMQEKLFTFAVLPPEVDRLYTRIWTTLKTGR